MEELIMALGRTITELSLDRERMINLVRELQEKVKQLEEEADKCNGKASQG